MNKVLLITLAISIFLISCSKIETTYTKRIVDGIEIISNKNIPANPDFKIELEKVCELDDTLLGRIMDADIDSKGNIYLSDFNATKIHIFTPYGKYIKSILRQGKGPGEIEYLGQFEIINDKIHIAELDEKKVMELSLDGKQIKMNTFDVKSSPEKIMRSDSCIVAFSGISNRKNKGLVVLNKSLKSYDYNYKLINTLHEYNVDLYVKKITDPHTLSKKYAVGKNSLYIADISYSNYRIYEFNSSGRTIRQINKNYNKTPLSDYHKKWIKEYNWNKDTDKFKYSVAIDMLYVDKNDYLWVKSAQNTNKDVQSFDIFKEGIFMNKITINEAADSHLIFKNDKLIIINSDRNKIKIYTYRKR